MDEKTLLSKKFILVGMDEIKISSREKNIIGSQALASCNGFILHNSANKKTIVGHLSTDTLINESSMINFILELNNLIEENNLKGSDFDLYLFTGATPSEQEIYTYQLEILNSMDMKKYKTIDILEHILLNIKTIKINNINNNPENTYQIVDEYGNLDFNVKNATLSKQFAFDSNSGEFVTDKVLFGTDYIEANKERILN